MGASYTENMSQRLAVVAAIDPTAQSSTTTTSTSDTIDMKDLRRVMFIIQTGDLGVGDTVDFKLYKGSATGTITTSVTAMTQLTAGDDNKQVVVEVKAESLGPANRYIAGQLKVKAAGAASATASAVALGEVARYDPSSTIKPDLTSVDEIVVA